MSPPSDKTPDHAKLALANITDTLTRQENELALKTDRIEAMSSLVEKQWQHLHDLRSGPEVMSLEEYGRMRKSVLTHTITLRNLRKEVAILKTAVKVSRRTKAKLEGEATAREKEQANMGKLLELRRG